MYTFESRVRYSETDQNAVLTMEALLDYFQDCSSLQSEDLGIGTDYLTSQQLGWVVNFWQIDVKRYPRIGERVRTGTSPYELKGMLGLRNFMMESEDGERLAEANSVWTLIDLAAMRPTKVPQIMIERYELFEKFDMEYLSRKIALPQEQMEQVRITRVEPHHIDTNGHMNNAWYYRIAQEALPEELRGIRPHRLLMEFKKQAFLGDELHLSRCQTADGVYVALGDADGTPYCKVNIAADEQRGDH